MRFHLQLLLVAVLAVAVASPAWGVPPKFTQQGRLLDVSGQPLTGTHGLFFALYGAETGGAQQWSEYHSVIFDNGYYTVTLGEQNSLDDLLFSGAGLWLDLSVDGVALTPRQELASVPWALRAISAERVDGGVVDASSISIGGSEVINSTGAWVGPTPSVDWSELSGVPADIADGDLNTDTLAATVCADGQVLVYAATGNDWVCGTDTDTTLTPAEVQAMVEVMTLNLQNLPQVNGNDVLTTASSLNPSNLDAGASTAGQVLTSDGNAASWQDADAGGCTEEAFTGADGNLYIYVNCATHSYVQSAGFNALTQSSSSISSLAGVGSLGYSTYCGLRPDDTIQCWGMDISNQISNAPTGEFNSIIAGYTFHCGLDKLDGIHCWGSDSGGSVSNTPSGQYSYLAVGQRNACAIDTNSAIVCWGQDSYGSVSNAPAGGTYSAVAITEGAGCALATDGTIACWGDDRAGLVSNTPSGTFSSIHMGEEMTTACALDSADNLTCWGEDSSNQVSNKPALAFSAVEIGYNFICGITTAGNLACWGSDGGGQVSGAPSGTFTSVQTSRFTACALNGSGELYCWGHLGSYFDYPAGLSWASFAMHQNNACGLLQDGSVMCWGEDVSDASCGVLADGSLLCWDTQSLASWSMPN